MIAALGAGAGLLAAFVVVGCMWLVLEERAA
jgi:hypothetical protein